MTDVLDDDKEFKRPKSRELELHTIRTVMKTENGRHFMWRCLQNCCTFDSTFNENPALHSRNEGRRIHGLWLVSELKEAAPDDYIKMVKEHLNE